MSLYKPFLIVLLSVLSASCNKDCRPSEMDCSAIKYACEPGKEVCGCDGKTYDCAMQAECEGKIADYKKGRCR